jgi:predicted O-methyltransferase YrrM
MKEIKMKEFINELFKTKVVSDEAGVSYPLHSGIHQTEGELLHALITENKCSNSIEIGCAYGVSSLYICSAISQVGNAHHTIVDPFQKEWKNIGVLNLKRAGFNSFDLIEELSELALPALLKEKRKFDFAFIDGWHTFDHSLIDFFYLNRMMEVGGIIAFHDVDMPSINKLMRYILNYPSYELIGTIQGVTYPVSFKRKIFDAALKPLALMSEVIPSKNVHQIFSSSIIEPNKSLGLDATLVAIRKTKADERDWRWFKEF